MRRFFCNNLKKVGPVSGLGLARLRALRNVYGVGARPYVQLIQYARTACAVTYITEFECDVKQAIHSHPIYINFIHASIIYCHQLIKSC